MCRLSRPSPKTQRSRPLKHLSRSILAFSLALVLPPPPAAAQSQPLDATDLAPPHFEAFTVQDGLSQEVWASVGFDEHGFVWAGSASQLARFDGYRWHLKPLPSVNSLVRDLASDQSGTLWAAFEQGGLARLSGDRWELMPGAPGDNFSTLRKPGGGFDLWLNGRNGMHRLEAGQWVLDPGHEALPIGLARGMARTESLFGEPREWLIRSPGQVFYRQPGKEPGPWIPFDVSHLGLRDYSDIVATHDRGQEELFLITYGQGFARITNEGSRLWSPDSPGIPSAAMYAAVATHSAEGERSLWIATRGGLLRLRDERIRVFDRSDGLPSNAVRNVAIQSQAGAGDVLWVATEGGLVRAHLEPSPWRTVSRLGASENGIFGLLVEPDDRGGERLWIGSSRQGLGLLEGGVWRFFGKANGALPSNSVLRIWRFHEKDGRGLRLLALNDGSVHRITDDLHFEPLDLPWSKPGSEALSALLSSGGKESALWIGTRFRGLYRRDSSGWRRMDTTPEQERLGILDLVEQRQDTGRTWIWAASERGVGQVDEGGVHFLEVSRQAAESGYRSLALVRRESRVELWAGSNSHGLIRFDVTDPTSPSLLSDGVVPPVPDPTVYSISEDSSGRIYVCTTNGVQQLRPTANGMYESRVFRRRDGLVHDECNTAGQQIDEHDRYWAGTLGGLSVYDPALAVADQGRRGSPHPLRITNVTLDGNSVGSPDRLDIKAGTSEVMVHFSVLSNHREAESRYRTQLAGLEAEPTSWTPQPARFFGNVPPGSYELLIFGRDWAGVESPSVRMIFVVEPRWWQRSIAQIIFGLFALAVFGGTTQFFNRRLLQRQQLLEKTVAERTSALEDANAKLLHLSYRDPLTGLANRRRLTESAEAIMAEARMRATPVGLILLDIDHFKGFNDRFGHPAGDAALEAVARLLEQHTRKGDIVARLGGEEFACLLSGADLEVTRRIAEQLRERVALDSPGLIADIPEGVTFSVGAVTVVPNPETSFSQLLGSADEALYAAKRGGRNRVEIG